MTQLLTLYCLHWIADFALQNPWVAEHKKTHYLVMWAHCSVYAGLFYVFGFERLFLPLLITHYLIDTLKARLNVGNMWTDQFLHHLVLVVCWLLFLN